MDWARWVVPISFALVLTTVGCGSDSPPTSLTIDTEGATAVVAATATVVRDCYRDGTQPETCTSATVPRLYDFCGELVGMVDLGANDVTGAVTVYPADNPRVGEATCLFTNPRASLSIELWRDPPASLCAATGGFDGRCTTLGDGYEAGRRADLPSISVAQPDRMVVSTVASPLLDDARLVAAAGELARAVFGVALPAEDLARVQPSSTKPE